MKRDSTITLGGQEYKIDVQPARASREWRKRIKSELLSVLDQLQAVGSLRFEKLEFGSMGELVGLARTIAETVADVPDTVVDLVFAYCPALAADRDSIESVATDDEFIAAFLEVLKLAFPFSSILSAVEIVPGGPSRETSPSSPSPSGEFGKTN